jgi:hypothetical protein
MSTTEQQSILTDVLNRVEAILDCGAATTAELGSYLLPTHNKTTSGIRVAEWIRSRKKSPTGEVALRMKEWASAKTLEISKRRMATKYNEAFKAVQRRRTQ